jgi:hypothetical protein
MSKLTLTPAAVAGALLALAFASPAAAGTLTRAWVSNAGSDVSTCGAVSAPCHTFQYVHDDILGTTGGEIDILNPGGYGVLSITKPLSIVNDGVGVAGILQVTSGHDAIAINTTGAVSLRGLTIEGGGIGKDGVGLSKVGALTIVNCAVRNFTHDGIYLQPTTALNFTILGTTASDNGNDGFEISPTSTSAGLVEGVFNNATAINNSQKGVSLNGLNTNGFFQMTLLNLLSSNNRSDGVYTTGVNARTSTTVQNTTSSYNSGTGFHIDGTSLLLFGNSNTQGNALGGVFVETNATGYSYLDNEFSDGTNATLSTFGAKQ